jgi:hypothetical protein
MFVVATAAVTLLSVPLFRAAQSNDFPQTSFPLPVEAMQVLPSGSVLVATQKTLEEVEPASMESKYSFDFTKMEGWVEGDRVTATTLIGSSPDSPNEPASSATTLDPANDPAVVLLGASSGRMLELPFTDEGGPLYDQITEIQFLSPTYSLTGKDISSLSMRGEDVLYVGTSDGYLTTVDLKNSAIVDQVLVADGDPVRDIFPMGEPDTVLLLLSGNKMVEVSRPEGVFTATEVPLPELQGVEVNEMETLISAERFVVATSNNEIFAYDVQEGGLVTFGQEFLNPLSAPLTKFVPLVNGAADTNGDGTAALDAAQAAEEETPLRLMATSNVEDVEMLYRLEAAPAAPADDSVEPPAPEELPTPTTTIPEGSVDEEVVDSPTQTPVDTPGTEESSVPVEEDESSYYARIDDSGTVVQVIIGGGSNWIQQRAAFGETWVKTWEGRPGHNRANIGMAWDGNNFQSGPS